MTNDTNKFKLNFCSNEVMANHTRIDNKPGGKDGLQAKHCSTSQPGLEPPSNCWLEVWLRVRTVAGRQADHIQADSQVLYVAAAERRTTSSARARRDSFVTADWRSTAMESCLPNHLARPSQHRQLVDWPGFGECTGWCSGKEDNRAPPDCSQLELCYVDIDSSASRL